MFLAKQTQKSRSILQDGSRFLACFGKENSISKQNFIRPIKNFWDHFREGTRNVTVCNKCA